MHRRLVDIHLRALSHLPLFLSPLMPIQEQGSPLATHLQCHHRLWQTTVPQPSLLVLRWADPHTGSHHRRRSRITLATSPQHPVRYPRAPVMATPSPKPHSSPTCSTKKANPTPLSTKTENRKKEVEEGRSREQIQATWVWRREQPQATSRARCSAVWGAPSATVWVAGGVAGVVPSVGAAAGPP
uniref:PH domain-containing protein n=1 Tax=Mesocestoides corti TaxID=53468 RepID=A0A5K3F966_MESCO